MRTINHSVDYSRSVRTELLQAKIFIKAIKAKTLTSRNSGSEMTEYTKRATSARSIQMAMEFIAQDDFEEMELGILRANYSNLKKNWNQFGNSHNLIMDAASNQNEVEEHLSLYETVEREFIMAKVALLKQIRFMKQNRNEEEQTEQPIGNIEQEQIEPEMIENSGEVNSSLKSNGSEQINQNPQQAQMNQSAWHFSNFKTIENTWGEFDGNLVQWQGFHDRFKAAVHDNEQLSGAFKFMYLQKSLKGKASRALGEWQLTDNNYAEAWERLSQLYERQYQTSAELVRKFHNLPKLDHANGAMVQKFSNVTHEMLRQLKALQYPVEHYDLFVVHGIHEKLDPETSKAWELYRSSERPTVQELLSFLDKQAKALSNVYNLEHKKSNETRKRKPNESEHHTKAKRTRTESQKEQNEEKERRSSNWACKLCPENPSNRIVATMQTTKMQKWQKKKENKKERSKSEESKEQDS